MLYIYILSIFERRIRGREKPEPRRGLIPLFIFFMRFLACLWLSYGLLSIYIRFGSVYILLRGLICMKVCLYARVSKALDQNPENQLLALREWAKNNGYEVFGEFVDEISSKDTRPNKEEVLKLLRRKEVSGVGFWSLDRWGRNMVELVMEMEEFGGSEQVLFSYQEALDLSTASGRLAGNILSALANFERDRIKERTLLGLARVKAQGKKLGRPRKNG